MTDETAADALNEQIEEAARAGDMEKANALYREQIGTTNALSIEGIPLPIDGGEVDDSPAAASGEPPNPVCRPGWWPRAHML